MELLLHLGFDLLLLLLLETLHLLLHLGFDLLLLLMSKVSHLVLKVLDLLCKQLDLLLELGNKGVPWLRRPLKDVLLLHLVLLVPC